MHLHEGGSHNALNDAAYCVLFTEHSQQRWKQFRRLLVCLLLPFHFDFVPQIIGSVVFQYFKNIVLLQVSLNPFLENFIRKTREKQMQICVCQLVNDAKCDRMPVGHVGVATLLINIFCGKRYL